MACNDVAHTLGTHPIKAILEYQPIHSTHNPPSYAFPLTKHRDFDTVQRMDNFTETADAFSVMLTQFIKIKEGHPHNQEYKWSP